MNPEFEPLSVSGASAIAAFTGGVVSDAVFIGNYGKDAITTALVDGQYGGEIPLFQDVTILNVPGHGTVGPLNGAGTITVTGRPIEGSSTEEFGWGGSGTNLYTNVARLNDHLTFERLVYRDLAIGLYGHGSGNQGYGSVHVQYLETENVRSPLQFDSAPGGIPFVLDVVVEHIEAQGAVHALRPSGNLVVNGGHIEFATSDAFAGTTQSLVSFSTPGQTIHLTDLSWDFNITRVPFSTQTLLVTGEAAGGTLILDRVHDLSDPLNAGHLIAVGENPNLILRGGSVLGDLARDAHDTRFLPGSLTATAGTTFGLGNRTGPEIEAWLSSHGVVHDISSLTTIVDRAGNILSLPGWLNGSTDGADFVDGTISDEELGGAGGDDTLMGHAGNDTIGGGLGNDMLDGGEGEDTAFFAVTASEVFFSTENGVLTSSGAEGQDTLLNFETIRFLDAEWANYVVTGDYGYLYFESEDETLPSTFRIDVIDLYDRHGWSSESRRYDENNELVFYRQEHDNGDVLTIDYFSDGTRLVRHVRSSDGTLSETLYSSEDEVVSRRTVTVSGYETLEIHEADGTMIRQWIDGGDQYNWQTQERIYDAEGTLISSNILYDDNRSVTSSATTTEITREDVNDNFGWQTETRIFVDGELQRYTQLHDSGDHLEVTYAEDGSEIHRHTQASTQTVAISEFSSTGELLSRRVVHADGYETFVDFSTDGSVIREWIDGADRFEWAHQVNIYSDDSNLLSSQIIIFDNGDTQETTFNPNGTRDVMIFTDTADAYDWETRTTFFDAFGAVDDIVFNFG